MSEDLVLAGLLSVFLVRRLWCWLRYDCLQFGEFGFDRPILCNLVRKRETSYVPTLSDDLVLKRETSHVPTLSDDLVLKRETLYVPTLSDDLVLKTILIELLSIISSVVSVLMHNPLCHLTQ